MTGDSLVEPAETTPGGDDGWKTVRVGELADNFDSLRKPVKSSDRGPGPYPYYGASGVVDHVDGYLLDGDYLLVSEDGENLRSRNLPITYLTTGKFWPNNHAHVLRGKDGRDTRFLAYAIEQCDVTGYLTGSAQPKLTKSALESLELRAPRASVRWAIAEVLGALDDKIAANTKRATTAELLAAATFAQSCAESSRTVTVSDAASLVARGITPAYAEDIDGTTLIIGQRCVRTPRVELGPARRTENRKLKPERMLRKGDILVNSTGMGSLGRVARWIGPGEATVDSHVSIVRFDPSLVDPTCAGFAMLRMETAIEALAEGSTGQTELPRASLGAMEIVVPRGETRALSERLDSLVDVSEHARAEVGSLAATRDALLPALMSGRLRVRDAERLAEDPSAVVEQVEAGERLF